MAWIEAHQGLARHPKTRRLARLLNLPLPTVIGHLFLLWWWALDYAQDGNLGKFCADDISDAVDYKGDSSELVEALTTAGFIDSNDDSLSIHDWSDYAGKFAIRRDKLRAQTRARVTKHRERVTTADCNADVTRYKDDVTDGNAYIHIHVPIQVHKDKDTNSASADALTVDKPEETPNVTKAEHSGESLEVKTASGSGHSRPVDRSTTRHNATSFDAFWQAYPRKTAKGAAEAAWRKLKPDEPLVARMLAAVEVAKQSAQWQRDGGQYIPLPSTWLNQRRWEDEHVAPTLSERRGHSRLPPAADSRESKYDEIDIIRRRMARQAVEARNNRGEV